MVLTAEAQSGERSEPSGASPTELGPESGVVGGLAGAAFEEELAGSCS